ncbi:MFS transporter [Caenimonas koreensis]|uniref:MFS transporter n=1 Tax=Caenimonas koreensis DSM 17982 TaxID=1121255 RepID=A0A844B485_9BURK|nr:MFS transporter [Caenimonas koreensis]MRD46347.1 MFS transporter [Caenimonas koreensis DSM 17982]
MNLPSAGWRYGLLGLPLAFVALPLYVQLPNFYAREFGVSLAALGAVLLVVRLLDAVVDPWIGAWIDKLFARSAQAVLATSAAAAVALAAGFAWLFFPPRLGASALLGWIAAGLVLTYAAYSILTVAHQSWGAMLGGDDSERSRVFAWREGLGLVGVLLASVLPVLAGLPVTTGVLCAALAAGWWAWSRSARPQAQPQQRERVDWRTPFRHAPFRQLLAVFLLNGIASAVPATLVLFFVQDRLQAPPSQEPLFLGSYFLCAALSIPLWVRLVTRIGLARTWLAGMALAVCVFIGASTLGQGDGAAFIAICALSGIALGTDLALPSALLASVIEKAGLRGSGEGIFFGWWNFATKLNLALAAGVALPVLGFAGYAPGVRTPEALTALTLAYCLLPCLLKCAAGALLYFNLIRPGGSS